MQSSNRTRISYIKESQWGETPATGDFQMVDFTGAPGFGESLNTAQSEIIRSDRQVADLVALSGEAAGSLNFEFAAKNLDDLIESAMFNEWATANVQSTEIDIAGNEITSTTEDFVAAGFVKGMLIMVSVPDESIWGITKVQAVEAGKITVGEDIGTVTAGPEVSINGSMITNGVTMKSLSFEKALLDAGVYFLYKGMVANTFNLSLSAASIMTGSFDFVGKDGTGATAPFSPGLYLDTPGLDSMNTSSNIARIRIDGQEIDDVFIQSMSIALNNNIEGQQAIRHFGNIGTRPGDCVLTGDMSIYFDSLQWYDRFKNETPFSMRIEVNKQGYRYVFEMPRCKLASEAADIGGRNQDIMDAVSYQALRDPVEGYTFRIHRIWDPLQVQGTPW